MILCSWVTIMLITGIVLTLVIELILYSSFLFTIFMICHGELYTLKPHPQHLNIFYLLIAFGTVVGSFFVAIISPIIFKNYFELPIGVALSLIIALIALIYYDKTFFYKILAKFKLFSSKKEAYIFILIFIPFLFISVNFIYKAVFNVNRSYNLSFRNFYGIVKVQEQKIQGETVFYLLHGKIVHGGQYKNGTRRYNPLTYYGKNTGIEIAIQNHPKRKSSHKNLHIAVLGLGAGELAAYGRKGDIIRFYEINSQVIQIANKYFTYLKDSKAKIHVIEGDARLSLEKEIKQTVKYDILVVDVFSDDSIPMHLMTKEAIDIYLKRLNSDGILAINMTNKYIDLTPVLQRHGHDFGKEVRFTLPKGDKGKAIFSSEWALLTSNKQFLNSNKSLLAQKTPQGNIRKVKRWTDDYNNLLQILK